MAKQTYTAELLQTANIFEKTTKARIKDVFYIKDLLTFVVFEGDMFKALGKNLENLKKVEALLKRKIKIVEFNRDLITFVKNLIHPYKVESITFEDGIVYIKDSNSKTKGLIIGAKAQNLRQYENIVKRYFEIKEVKVI
ncbi:MAG: NusA-like transcription termination signal-binding factor [Candidatus Woesearchaeota archaeon]